MTKYTAIDPQYYKQTPIGIERECIEYIELLPHSQATAGKYIYRVGNKDELSQDLNKTLWYMKRAQTKRMVRDLQVLDAELLSTIDGMATWRSNIFYLICTGNLISADYKIKSALEALKTHNLYMDAPLTVSLSGVMVER